MATPSNPLQLMNPQEIAALAEAGTTPYRREDLDIQLELAKALQGSQGHFSGIGGTYGAVGDILRNIKSTQLYNDAMQQRKGGLDQLSQTGAAYGGRLHQLGELLQQIQTASQPQGGGTARKTPAASMPAGPPNYAMPPWLSAGGSPPQAQPQQPPMPQDIFNRLMQQNSTPANPFSFGQ
jgi:hypothetical protein